MRTNLKITQTFWTANKSLLEHSFWWYNPECHLMSWALSCLSLRENYDNVVLYTDSNGYKVFGELLKLPYSDIIVQYDKLRCPDSHWAYPKMLTYSLQKEPFIHVDGDVYLPYRLDDSIESAGLIAQNKERSGKHYRGMMNDILRRNLKLPGFLKAAIERDSIPSYNAGVLGGNDLDFIQEYCQTAFRLIEDNRLNELTCANINVNNNVFFEQVLFAALAEERGKTVTTVLDRTVRDDGYSYGCFCNLYMFERTKLMHIIGGHKRNLRFYELLAKTLLDRYPEYYKRIIELFPQNHKRLQSDVPRLDLPDLSVQMCIARYQDYLCDLLARWKRLGKEELYVLEKKLSAYPHFMNADVDEQQTFVLGRNPHLSMFEIPKHWPRKAADLLKERINAKRAHCPDVSDIVCIPCLQGDGYKELLISDLCYNILVLLEQERTFGELQEKLSSCFTSDVAKDKGCVYRMIMTELEYLFYSGQIYARKQLVEE